MGYLVSPYSYSNGSAGSLGMANKIGLPPFFCHNGDHLANPPPAHCGIAPYQLDPKAMGLYTFPSTQYPYPMISPEMSQVASWHTPSVYSAASSFRGPYPSSIPMNTTLSSDFPFRFSPSLLPSVHTSPHHVLNTHPAIVTTAKQDCNNQESPSTNHRFARNLESKNIQGTDNCRDNSSEKKKPHIKKPLNAFMLYMKEMRAKVVAECTLKESAAINQILGRRWHSLSREQQAKYYELAKQARALHMQLYPNWSARDNYGFVSKKKKRKKDRSPADSGGNNNLKKCRARFGLDQQSSWCKPCRRKKKCIRYMEATGGSSSSSTKEERFNELDDVEGPQSEEDEDIDHEPLGEESSASGDDIHKSTEEDNESLNQSLSSPGCLSGLSSLQSPSASLASPLNLLTSPAIPTNPLLNTFQSAGNEQTNMQGQPSTHILALHGNQLTGNCSLNQHLQQQQSLNKLSQHPLHGPQQHQVASAGTPGDRTQSYVSEINNSGTTALLPTLSTSSTSSVGSASGYGTSSSTSNYTSNSATLSPSSLSDRMVRSLLSNNSAMLLGNRVSNLAVGPANQQGKIIVSNNNRCLPEFAKTIDSDLSGHSNSTTPETTNTVPVTNVALTSNASLNVTGGRCNATTSLSNNSYKQLLHTGVSTKINPSSSRTGTPNTHHNNTIIPASNQIANCINEAATSLNMMPLQRNPIGANPRDINNPLNINQLTKQPREQSTSNCGKGNNRSNNDNNKTSNMCTSNVSNTPNMSYSNQYHHHHPSSSPSLPSLPPLPTQHNIFGSNSNNFTQHFQRQFGHRLITAAVAAGHVTAVSSDITQPVTTNITTTSNNSSSKNNTTATMSNVIVTPAIDAPVNVDIVRRSTSDTSTSNKNSCGAISVT
ncbi:transcription factor pangolin isoform 11-T29 [Glossina fuscipes fuscipes]